MRQSSLSITRRPHVLGPSGEAALAALLRRRPLLGFDFDGTLAPIVPTPEQARISRSVSGKLRRLAARLPVVIITGRSAEDVRGRLDFEPYCIVGNHGADAGLTAEATRTLDGVRGLLSAHAQELQQAGVTVEDKGLSIALHHRLARWPLHAAGLIFEMLAGMESECRTSQGKMVVDVVPSGAPDKGTAIHRLVQACGAPCALYVGDDVNDEPVFAGAPDDWLTVRIGRDAPASRADYFLDSTADIGMLLDRLIAHSGT